MAEFKGSSDEITSIQLGKHLSQNQAQKLRDHDISTSLQVSHSVNGIIFTDAATPMAESIA